MNTNLKLKKLELEKLFKRPDFELSKSQMSLLLGGANYTYTSTTTSTTHPQHPHCTDSKTVTEDDNGAITTCITYTCPD